MIGKWNQKPLPLCRPPSCSHVLCVPCGSKAQVSLCLASVPLTRPRAAPSPPALTHLPSSISVASPDSSQTISYPARTWVATLRGSDCAADFPWLLFPRQWTAPPDARVSLRLFLKLLFLYEKLLEVIEGWVNSGTLGFKYIYFTKASVFSLLQHCIPEASGINVLTT